MATQTPTETKTDPKDTAEAAPAETGQPSEEVDIRAGTTEVQNRIDMNDPSF